MSQTIQHPNEELITRFYELFAQGQFDTALRMCSDDITFKVPGNTSFSGIQTKATFQDWIQKVWTLSEGTFRETAYQIIANDSHGVVLLDHYLTRNGKETHYRVNHIWQIRNGIFTAWEEWAGDEAMFNVTWS